MKDTGRGGEGRGEDERRAEEWSRAGRWVGRGAGAALGVILNYCPDVFHLYLFFDLLCYTLNMSNQICISCLKTR